MLSRAISLIVCVVLMGFGITCISIGNFGGIMLGSSAVLLGFIISVIIIWDVLEQNVNQPKTNDDHDYSLFALLAELRSQQLTEIKELNTPDPHLIHPDDAKRLQPLTDAELDQAVAEAEQRRQASGHDDYSNKV